MFKSVFVFTSALLVQSIFGQCINPVSYGPNTGIGIIPSPPIVAPGCGCGGVGVIEGSAGGVVVSPNLSAINSASTISLSNIASQLASSYGGNFIVSSYSPIAPSALSIASDNLLIEGPLSVYGQMPFISAINLEGALAAGGYASAAYNCGNGEVGILEEGPVLSAGSSGIVAPGLPLGYGSPSVGLGAGIGCGSGVNPGLGGLRYGGCGCI